MNRAAPDRTDVVANSDRDPAARSDTGWYDPDSTTFATARDERSADSMPATDRDDETAWIDWN